MKKHYFLLAAAQLLLCAESYAADSTVTVTGYLRDNTCTVSGSSQDFTVDMHSTNSQQFSSEGATTPSVPFHITLNGCGKETSSVRVGFSGVADEDLNLLLKLDSGPSMASGVGIQILNENRELLPINEPLSQLSWTKLSGGSDNVLTFYARLMSVNSTVKAGRVSATATFTLEYL